MGTPPRSSRSSTAAAAATPRSRPRGATGPRHAPDRATRTPPPACGRRRSAVPERRLLAEHRLEDPQQPQDLDVQPDQREGQAERELPGDLLRQTQGGGVVDVLEADG